MPPFRALKCRPGQCFCSSPGVWEAADNVHSLGTRLDIAKEQRAFPSHGDQMAKALSCILMANGFSSKRCHTQGGSARSHAAIPLAHAPFPSPSPLPHSQTHTQPLREARRGRPQNSAAPQICLRRACDSIADRPPPVSKLLLLEAGDLSRRQVAQRQRQRPMPQHPAGCHQWHHWSDAQSHHRTHPL
jgi:hypothetical protein